MRNSKIYVTRVLEFCEYSRHPRVGGQPVMSILGGTVHIPVQRQRFIK